MSNPFQPIPKEKKPNVVVTDYNKDSDKYVIEYGEVERVKITGKKDTDFVIKKDVVEINRTLRQEILDSNADDVGILNILEKVRTSGDGTLLNQTHRVPMAGAEKDALGHNVEPVVDVTKYQVDQVAALESYKVGAAAFESLDPDLKKKLNFEQVANLSDQEIDAYIGALIEARKVKTEKIEKSEGEK